MKSHYHPSGSWKDEIFEAFAWNDLEAALRDLDHLGLFAITLSPDPMGLSQPYITIVAVEDGDVMVLLGLPPGEADKSTFIAVTTGRDGMVMGGAGWGQTELHPRERTVPKAKAMQALRYFCEHQSLSEDLDWR